MAHRPRWQSLSGAAVVAVLLISACTTGSPATTAPSARPSTGTASAPASAPASAAATSTAAAPSATAAQPTGTAAAPSGSAAAPSSTAGAPTGEVYPANGEVTCANGDTAGSFDGEDYSGKVKSISAPDPMTVVFTLCSGDGAFLPKMAFSVFSIYDADWLATHVADGSALNEMNGTGPLQMSEWRKGSEIDYTAFANYWGDASTTAKAVLKWQADPAQRLTDLKSGTVTGYALVGPTDFDTISGDSTLLLAKPPEGQNLNTLYLGMNHNDAPWDNENVRKALAIGIDKQRLVDNFYPAGSQVADYFTPCALQFGCEGDPWPAFNKETAKEMILAEFPDGITTKIQYRTASRPYIPVPVDVATDLQAQLAEIGITAELEEQESSTFIGNSNQGLLDGLFLLGWGADYPEVTNFLDYHFGPGCTSAFGDCYPDIAEALSRGNSTSDETIRQQAYTDANNAILANVPMVPLVHGAIGNGYLAGTEGAQSSSISTESLYRMTAPEGDTVVFEQTAEPGTVFCADETDGEALRACEQSLEGLYGFDPNSTDPAPRLATSCDPNEDGSVWTCHLREGVTFHDGATFDAHDVITSFAMQWDAANELHKGSTSQFEYWTGLWGDFLHRSAQPAPPES